MFNGRNSFVRSVETLMEMSKADFKFPQYL